MYRHTNKKNRKISIFSAFTQDPKPSTAEFKSSILSFQALFFAFVFTFTEPVSRILSIAVNLPHASIFASTTTYYTASKRLKYLPWIALIERNTLSSLPILFLFRRHLYKPSRQPRYQQTTLLNQNLSPRESLLLPDPFLVEDNRHRKWLLRSFPPNAFTRSGDTLDAFIFLLSSIVSHRGLQNTKETQSTSMETLMHASKHESTPIPAKLRTLHWQTQLSNTIFIHLSNFRNLGMTVHSARLTLVPRTSKSTWHWTKCPFNEISHYQKV